MSDTVSLYTALETQVLTPQIQVPLPRVVLIKLHLTNTCIPCLPSSEDLSRPPAFGWLENFS